MTAGRVRATGRGWWHARLSIAGWPYEAVTGRPLERTATDGRLRRVGFDLSGVQLQARADIARATLDTQGFRAGIEDFRGLRTDGARGRIWSDAFRRPSAQTTLSADLTTSATTANVHDTSEFPSSGYIHIGTEAIAYSGKTATSFTGLTRGTWGTIAQAHFVPDGEQLHYPLVSDRPLSLEGRRAELYLYGPGDDPQGAGTLRWVGICATDASYDGTGRWSFTVDPITRLLAQQIGGDLSESVPIRGILHPITSPVVFGIVNNTAGVAVKVAVAGFWETQADFCASATSAIASAIAGVAAWTWATGSAITAEASAEDRLGFRLVYQVGSAGTPHEVSVAIDSDFGSVRILGAGGWVDADGVPVPTPALSGIYYRAVEMPVPRAVVGPRGPAAWLTSDVTLPTGAVTVGLERRIYLGGLVVPSSTMAAFLEDGDGGEGQPLTITGADTTNRYLEGTMSFALLGPRTKIRLGRRLAVGTVESLRAALAASSPGLANTGAMPLIGPLDIVPATEVTEAAASNPLGANRVFDAFEAVDLSEYVEHELRALGCYQRLASSGVIEWARIRLALETDDAAAVAIDDGDIMGPVRVERSQYGTIGSVVYRTGYEPRDGKHRSSVTARDVQATSPARSTRAHEIAQRSYPESRVVTAVEWWAHSPPEATPADVARLAFPIFGTFGSSYDVWTIPLGPRRGTLRIGDSVTVTSSRIPDPDTGELGVSGRIGLVTGTSEDLSTGQVQVEVIFAAQRFAGYAPGVEVSGQTNVSGNIWDVDFSAVADYIDSADVRDHFRVGDLVRVTQFDSATPTEVTGTVTTETSATRLRVTFDAVWTPGGSTWMLRARASTSYAATDRIAGYAFQADATSRLIDHTPTDARARVFAP